MQEPPPVPKLLTELVTFAEQVQKALSGQPVDWHWRPKEGEWSLNEVVCHLRDVEQEVHQVRFLAVLEKDNPFVAGATTDEWVQSRKYGLQDGPTARDGFLTARAHTVGVLQGLDEASWQRSGRHAFFGPTTLQELVFLAVRHDQAHWQQIEKLLSHQL